MNRYYIKAQTAFWKRQFAAWADMKSLAMLYRYQCACCASKTRAAIRATRLHFELLPF